MPKPTKKVQEVERVSVPWKWITVRVTSSMEGTFDAMNLLKPLAKAEYLSLRYSWQYGDQDTYVDMDTRKLWVVANQGPLKLDEFNKEVLKLGIEKGITVEEEPSSTLMSLQWVKHHFVEWYVESD